MSGMLNIQIDMDEAALRKKIKDAGLPVDSVMRFLGRYRVETQSASNEPFSDEDLDYSFHG